MTNHPVCQGLRRSLGHGTSQAKQKVSGKLGEAGHIVVFISRLLLQATAVNFMWMCRPGRQCRPCLQIVPQRTKKGIEAGLLIHSSNLLLVESCPPKGLLLSWPACHDTSLMLWPVKEKGPRSEYNTDPAFKQPYVTRKQLSG